MRLRPFQCSNCGAAAQIKEGQEKAVCKSCGSEIALPDVLQIQAVNAKKFPNPTPIKLGMKATIQGIEYEVIGRIVNYCREEGVSYYWNEFQLLADDGSFMYIGYDEGSYYTSKPFIPTNPIGPNEIKSLGIGNRIAIGKTATITEINAAIVAYVEGELTYSAAVNDASNFLEAKHLSGSITIEWTQDEIEFYENTNITAKQLFIYFDLRDEIAKLEKSEKQSGSVKRFAVVCIVLSIVAFIGWSIASSSGKLIEKGELPLSSVTAEGKKYGPFYLDTNKAIHKLDIYGNMRESSAWVAGVIEEADGNEVIGAQGDFWDESGTDDEGYWHESSLNASKYFIAKDAGPYYVHIYCEKDNFTDANATAGFKLYNGAAYPGYLLTYGIITLLIGIICLSISHKEKLKKMAESMDDD